MILYPICPRAFSGAAAEVRPPRRPVLQPVYNGVYEQNILLGAMSLMTVTHRAPCFILIRASGQQAAIIQA
jgi:hypothetical protein